MMLGRVFGRANAMRRLGVRSIFVKIVKTPNPASLKFVPGKKLMPEGRTVDFGNLRSAQRSPLARSIFTVEGVTRVMISTNFLAVTVQDQKCWTIAQPDVFGKLEDFFSSDKPVVLEEGETGANKDTIIHDDDDDAVALIKELVESKIRPYVQEDGGDVVYRGFTDGVVSLELQGSCVGCPSASLTLKHGIEAMLMHYVPEVKSVEEYVDGELERASRVELDKLEKKFLATGSQEEKTAESEKESIDESTKKNIDESKKEKTEESKEESVDASKEGSVDKS